MKNKILNLFIVAIVCCLLVSCNKEQKKDKIEYIPFKLDEEDNWGMLKPDGTVLFKDEFEGLPSFVVNGVFTVKDKNGLSVYRVSEKPKAIKGCEDLKDAGVMTEGIIPIVKKGERIKYVDINGKEKFTLNPYKNKEITAVSSRFYDGLASFCNSDNKIGWINTSGKVVIEPKFDDISVQFNNGLAVAMKKEKDKEGKEKYVSYIIDKNGKEKKKLSSDTYVKSIYEDGRFIATVGEKEKRIVFLDKDGNITKKIASKVRKINKVTKDLYIYEDDNMKWGINNSKDETIIRAKYENLQYINDNKFLAEKDNGKFVIINKNDDKIKEFDDYEGMMYFEDLGIIIAGNRNDKIELINLEGELISKDDYFCEIQEENKGVRSDYFNVEELSNKIASYVSQQGIGNIKLGDNVSRLLSERTPYSYKNETSAIIYNSESGVEDGNKYHFSTYIYSDVAIAQEQYSTEYYYGYAFRHYDGVAFNKSAKVFGINLLVRLYTSDNEKNVEKLSKSVRNIFAKKGYKTTYNGKLVFELTKDNSVIIVSQSHTKTLVITLLTKDKRTTLDSNEELEEIFKEGIDDFAEDDGYPIAEEY
ncbi:MAG: WG repeat-containing protein [Bacteroidales bacterium]|nr:WG repeat-containing protein [Bacteroidales bacterium]MBQ9255441.1 WG repeat-containing protein [Bacteroidales bacterium]